MNTITTDASDGITEYLIGDNNSEIYFVQADGNLNRNLTIDSDERRKDKMLSRQALIEACADSDVNLNWEYRQIIRNMTSDEWMYFVARLLLGAELLPLLDSFREKPQFVKVVE